jgi:hypothetical protein
MLAVSSDVNKFNPPVGQIYLGGISAKLGKAGYAAIWETDSGIQALAGQADQGTVSQMLLRGLTHVLRAFPSDLDISFYTNSTVVLSGPRAKADLRNSGRPMTREAWPAKHFDKWIEIFQAVKARSGRTQMTGSLGSSDPMIDSARAIARLAIGWPAMEAFQLITISWLEQTAVGPLLPGVEPT